MSRKRKPDGLESKVMKFKPSYDDVGKYVPYCTFGFHQGIVLKKDVCEKRYCTHYTKLYFSY